MSPQTCMTDIFYVYYKLASSYQSEFVFIFMATIVCLRTIWFHPMTLAVFFPPNKRTIIGQFTSYEFIRISKVLKYKLITARSSSYDFAYFVAKNVLKLT